MRSASRDRERNSRSGLELAGDVGDSAVEADLDCIGWILDAELLGALPESELFTRAPCAHRRAPSFTARAALDNGRDAVDGAGELGAVDLHDLVVALRDDAGIIGERAVDQLRA